MTEYIRVDVEGLNDLLGGGLVRGGVVVLEQSRNGLVDELVMNVGLDVVDEQLSMTLLPPMSLTREQLDGYLTRLHVSLKRLLDNDQLFVLDTAGTWAGEGESVFDIRSPDEVRSATTTALERSRARGTVHVVDVSAMSETVGANDSIDLLEWYDESLRGRRDLLMAIVSLDETPAAVRDAYRAAATQIIGIGETDGRRTLTVERTPDGETGATRGLRYLTEEPFVELV
jgi:hypothetical protein